MSEQVSLADLVAAYGEKREEAGRILADLAHRCAMLESLAFASGAVIGPLSPVEQVAPPVPIVKPKYGSGHGGRRGPTARSMILAIVGESTRSVELNQIHLTSQARGYTGKIGTLRIVASEMVDAGELVGDASGYSMPVARLAVSNG